MHEIRYIISFNSHDNLLGKSNVLYVYPVMLQ